ncbi:Panacea domain-containing protein [Alloalcanivorax venustensis]|jgi:hypothetical protein|uniref:Panacea domain-containing protein n=1 Tax=Alloalcanivorax venustensis TaxID=172371 RepID=UPI003511E713
MNKLQRILAYLCLNYPHKDELSKARVTKLVYLADWFSSLLDGEQMTDIKWVFNHYGPYVDDVVDSANGAYGFSLEKKNTMYGTPKYVVSYSGGEDIDISDREKKILDAVIEKTKPLHFNDFISYVYSTYPVKSNERYASLDLVSLAQRYKELKKVS